jgi:tetratricopeptide (TPR) repeat protein
MLLALSLGALPLSADLFPAARCGEADDEEEAPEPRRKSEEKPPVEEVKGPRGDILRGEYEGAIEGFRKIAEGEASGEDRISARRDWAEALLATGKYPEALEVLRGGDPGKRPAAEGKGFEAPALAALAGRILRETGKLEEARRALEKPAGDEKAPLADRVECLVELGRVEAGSGRLEEARKAFEASIDLYKQSDVDEAEKLPAETFVSWALALIGLNRFKEAEEIMFSQAEEKDARCPALLLERGRMFLAKYNFPDSRSFFKDALARNPKNAEAMVSLAENYLIDFMAGPKRYEEAEKNIESALEVNPRSAGGLRARGSLWLSDGNYRKAIEDFRRSLDVNPACLETRGLLAACRFLLSEKAEFSREEAAALSINPKAAAFYHTVALALERRFRYVDSVRMCDRALALDPDYWPAYMTLGINCFRTGENARGREFMEKSWAKDKYNVWVFNTRKLIQYMDENYTAVEDGGFVFYFPKEEAKILTAYLVPLLKEARARMESRYKMRLDGTIQVEDFSAHKWFSARTVGLPDFAAAGATFGKVITLTTPKALPQNWGVVAWHEFAHVIALALTEHRVPRWFTEGLSVYEEGLDRPYWARNFQRELADAWASRRLLPMAEIDFGFSKPKYPQQILISYFQGCRIVQLIVDRWGFDKVLEMLKGYHDEKSTAQIFKEALGMSLEEFDKEFEASMARWVESNGYRPRVDLDTAALSDLETRAEASPKDARLQAELAWAYFCAGNDVDASLTAAKAIEADPKCGDAHAVLGLLREKDKKDRQAREAYEKALAAGTRFAAVCHAKIGAALSKDDDARAKAIEHLEAAKKLSPVAVAGSPPKGNVYYQLAKIYEDAGDPEKANLQMVEVARFAVEDVECRRRIVQYSLEKKDPKTAARYLDELLFLNPFDEKFHELLARAAEEAGELDTSIRENLILLGMPRSNPRKVRLSLARAYLAKGERQKAHAEAKALLEIDPEHEEAKEILEKTRSF